MRCRHSASAIVIPGLVLMHFLFHPTQPVLIKTHANVGTIRVRLISYSAPAEHENAEVTGRRKTIGGGLLSTCKVIAVLMIPRISGICTMPMRIRLSVYLSASVSGFLGEFLLLCVTKRSIDEFSGLAGEQKARLCYIRGWFYWTGEVHILFSITYFLNTANR